MLGTKSAPWCVQSWEANATKVPMGMSAFQQALGLPVQLYAPYFCNDTAYLSNFSLVRSDASLSPDCFDFVSAAGGLLLLCVSHDAYSNSGLSCVYLGCRRLIVISLFHVDELILCRIFMIRRPSLLLRFMSSSMISGSRTACFLMNLVRNRLCVCIYGIFIPENLHTHLTPSL